ncbi:hypothetical protein, partial [Salmonella sp. s54925]|uniref:hypothetical protein n=1 Tax=Salmonella sp. s54925 TaxID=3159674 RepID=UPI00397F48A0
MADVVVIVMVARVEVDLGMIVVHRRGRVATAGKMIAVLLDALMILKVGVQENGGTVAMIENQALGGVSLNPVDVLRVVRGLPLVKAEWPAVENV